MRSRLPCRITYPVGRLSCAMSPRTHFAPCLLPPAAPVCPSLLLGFPWSVHGPCLRCNPSLSPNDFRKPATKRSARSPARELKPPAPYFSPQSVGCFVTEHTRHRRKETTRVAGACRVVVASMSPESRLISRSSATNGSRATSSAPRRRPVPFQGRPSFPWGPSKPSVPSFPPRSSERLRSRRRA